MSIIDLEAIAAAYGYALVPQDIYDDMIDVVVEAEALRCDLDLLTATLVDDAITGGLGSR